MLTVRPGLVVADNDGLTDAEVREKMENWALTVDTARIVSNGPSMQELESAWKCEAPDNIFENPFYFSLTLPVNADKPGRQPYGYGFHVAASAIETVFMYEMPTYAKGVFVNIKVPKRQDRRNVLEQLLAPSMPYVEGRITRPASSDPDRLTLESFHLMKGAEFRRNVSCVRVALQK